MNHTVTEALRDLVSLVQGQREDFNSDVINEMPLNKLSISQENLQSIPVNVYLRSCKTHFNIREIWIGLQGIRYHRSLGILTLK